MQTDSLCALCVDVLPPSLITHESFAVLPSVGALVAGHILLVPKRHVRRWLALNDDEQRQADRLINQLIARLGSQFGRDIHLFEHGSSARGTGVACSVEHAHIHALPTDKRILSRLQHDYLWQPVVSRDQMRQLVGDSEYLWYQAPDGSQCVSVAQGGFPSQYLRQVFAEELGIAHWNWREFPGSNIMTQTVLGFSSAQPITKLDFTSLPN